MKPENRPPTLDRLTTVAIPMTFKRGDDGFLHIEGLASDDTLDLDGQRCDPTWLDAAIPKWLQGGGNFREMHQPSAVGKAHEAEKVGTGWKVAGIVVDPTAITKTETGVYSMLSVGIKNATVVKDASAPNGRINGGEVIEISLVDRGAKPSAKLSIVKSVNGTLEPTDVFKADDFMDRGDVSSDVSTSSPVTPDLDTDTGFQPCSVCNGLGTTSDLNNPAECAHCHGTKTEPVGGTDTTPSVPGREDPDANANPGNKNATADTAKTTNNNEQPGGGYPINNVKQLRDAIQAFGRSKDPAKTKAHIKARAKALGRADLIPDNWAKSLEAELAKIDAIDGLSEAQKDILKADAGQWMHDPAELQSIRTGLVSLIEAELNEMASGADDETCDISQLTYALDLFLCWWSGEASEGETTAPFPTSESDDDMGIYTQMGVSPDLIKSASAPDATDETKNELRAEIIKSLGLESVTDTEAKLAAAIEKAASLEDRLATVEQMAAPGGPAKTGAANKTATSLVEVIKKSAEYNRLIGLAETVTDPEDKRGYYADAQKVQQELNALQAV